jgi:tetratricopeptide (TPR) repeat protein
MRKIAPLLAFGILFFFACHSLESTVFALEIAHEHRNYLASYGLLLLVFYYLLIAGKSQYKVNLRHGLATAIIAVFTINTAVRAGNWSNHVDLALVNVEHHPNSARSNIYAGKIYFELAAMTDNEAHYLALARQHFKRATAADNYNLSGQFALLVLDDREGNPINQKQLMELAQRLQAETLSPATVNSLMSLNQCEQKGPCGLPSLALNILFRAILENPTLAGTQRSHVLTEITQHLVSHGNIEGAIYFAERAVKDDPKSPQPHLNYANLLIATNQYDMANSQIQRARQLDRYHQFAKRIDQQQKLLEQALANHAGRGF